MPLETASYLTDLVVTNPAHSDGLNQADAHMRLMKATIKATFPNFTSAPLNSTQANIDGAATQYARQGDVPPGAIMDFAMASPPAGWLTCDGQAVSRTTYAALFAAIGGTWGAGDGSTTFNVPSAGSRFRRMRDNSSLSGTVGTYQSPCNYPHTHTGGGNTGFVSNDHTHSYSGSGTTSSMNRSNPHSHSYTTPSNPGSSTGGGAFGIPGANTGATTGATDINHEHTYGWSGTTSGISSNHYHGYSFTTSGGSADGNETRPYSFTVLTCIKT